MSIYNYFNNIKLYYNITIKIFFNLHLNYYYFIRDTNSTTLIHDYEFLGDKIVTF